MADIEDIVVKPNPGFDNGISAAVKINALKNENLKPIPLADTETLTFERSHDIGSADAPSTLGAYNVSLAGWLPNKVNRIIGSWAVKPNFVGVSVKDFTGGNWAASVTCMLALVTQANGDVHLYYSGAYKDVPYTLIVPAPVNGYFPISCHWVPGGKIKEIALQTLGGTMKFEAVIHGAAVGDLIDVSTDKVVTTYSDTAVAEYGDSFGYNFSACASPEYLLVTLVMKEVS